MMRFRFLDEVVPGININLALLKRDTQRYSMLLYQHEGILFASETRVGNKDQDKATKQVSAYLDLLLNKNTDFGMTPEYTCPLANLYEVLSDPEKWPNPEKLWLLGLESIRKDELQGLISHYEKTKNIQFCFDQKVLDGTKNFLDPVVYLFRATVGDEQKLMAVLQFKTHHMGVWSGGDIERNNLIEGSEIYVLRNGKTSVGLFTVICSEAMNLQDELTATVQEDLLWSDLPYLILNPQVNPGPTHNNFLNFRNFVFRTEKKEIIDLNWNNQSKIMTETLVKSGSSRSGIFLKSSDVNFNDYKRFKRNHALGLYYFYFGKDRHVFLLNSLVHAFLIENLSVSITSGTSAQQRRDGPEVRETYKLTEEFGWDTLNLLSDGHLEFLAESKCSNPFLIDTKNCILEKERLVCISSGEIPEKSTLSWSDMNQLSSIKLLENTELNRRLTVAQDKDDESTQIRSFYVTAVEELNNIILKDKANYPTSLAGLKSKELLVGFSQKKDQDGKKIIQNEYFRYNIVSDADELVNATICYVPLAGENKARRVYTALRGLFDTGNMSRGRVVVYYKQANQYYHISDEEAASFTNTNTFADNSMIK